MITYFKTNDLMIKVVKRSSQEAERLCKRRAPHKQPEAEEPTRQRKPTASSDASRDHGTEVCQRQCRGDTSKGRGHSAQRWLQPLPPKRARKDATLATDNDRPMVADCSGGRAATSMQVSSGDVSARSAPSGVVSTTSGATLGGNNCFLSLTTAWRPVTGVLGAGGGVSAPAPSAKTATKAARAILDLFGARDRRARSFC